MAGRGGGVNNTQVESKCSICKGGWLPGVLVGNDSGSLSPKEDEGGTIPFRPACAILQDSKHDSELPVDFDTHFSFVNFVIGISSQGLAIGCLTVFIFSPFLPPEYHVYFGAKLRKAES